MSDMAICRSLKCEALAAGDGQYPSAESEATNSGAYHRLTQPLIASRPDEHAVTPAAQWNIG
jgi:hypothetical protein